MPGLSCASHSGSAPGSPRETFVTCRTAHASELPDVAWQAPRLAGGERLDGHSSVTSSPRTDRRISTHAELVSPGRTPRTSPDRALQLPYCGPCAPRRTRFGVSEPPRSRQEQVAEIGLPRSSRAMVFRCSPEQDLTDHRPVEINDETPGSLLGRTGYLALKLITRPGASEVGVHLRDRGPGNGPHTGNGTRRPTATATSSRPHTRGLPARRVPPQPSGIRRPADPEARHRGAPWPGAP